MATIIDLQDWLGDLVANIEPRQDELEEAAQHQLQRIEERTASGIGVDLQVFTGYSPHTKKTGPVDLRKTGEMLDSIVIESEDNQARIYFASEEAAQTAVWNNEGTRWLPERYFFGASINDHEEIVSDIRAALFRRLNNG